MKITSVTINNRKKKFEIITPKGAMSFPFSKLPTPPTASNKITEVYVDPELAYTGITYNFESGKEDSIPLDAFLDYNKDPEYLKKMLLHRLTLSAIKVVKQSRLTKREISRKMKTSPTQLYRLLDTANYRKTIDQMIRLLGCLGHEVDLVDKTSFRIAA